MRYMRYRGIGDDTKEEIFVLRHINKLSYKKISDQLFEEGKKIGEDGVSEIYFEMCEKRKVEPHLRITRKNLDTKVSKIIKQLRAEGYYYREISEYLYKNGVVMCDASVRNTCLDLGISVPKIKRKKVRPDRIPISDEEIFELRQQGKSYDDIVNYYKEKGIKISKESISRKCKRVYAEKGILEPKLKPFSKRKKNNLRELVSEEDIYEFKEAGLTYQEISNFYKEKGIEISLNLISKICNEVYAKKGEQIPKVIKKDEIPTSDDKIFELREQGFSYKQIADYYSANGVKISLCAIRDRCVRIYSEKGILQPKDRDAYMLKGLKELDEELNKLLLEKSKSKQLLQSYEEHTESDNEKVKQNELIEKEK